MLLCVFSFTLKLITVDGMKYVWGERLVANGGNEVAEKDAYLMDNVWSRMISDRFWMNFMDIWV